MKTLKDFLKNYSSNPDLHKKTFKAGGLAFSEFKENPSDYYAANTGSVPGMIYYTDTVKFAKNNHLQILQALEDFEEETGEDFEEETGGRLNKPSTNDETQYFNWLAWFAWESMAGELISYLEN